MDLLKKYAGYVDTEGIRTLFGKLQKHLGDNRTAAAEECGITTKAVYDWEKQKEGVKLSTKIKILEKTIDELPVETFRYLTQNLYDSSSETLMSCLTTLYEQSFDAKDEKEYLTHVNEFENVSGEFAGLIYKNRDLEVNHMFSKLLTYAKSQNYHWTTHQTVLYDSKMVKQMIPQIISSWVYYGLPISAEELAARNKFPLEFVQAVGDELNQQLLTPPPVEDDEGVRVLKDDSIRVGLYVKGPEKTLMSTAATIRTSKKIPSSEEKKSLVSS